MTAVEALLQEQLSSDDMNNGGVWEIVVEVMEENARERSIAFAEWLNKSYEKSGTGFWFNEIPIAGKQTYYKTDELYNKFEQETKQK